MSSKIFTLGWRPSESPLSLHEPFTEPVHPMVLEVMRGMFEQVPMQLRTKKEVRWEVRRLNRPARQVGQAALSVGTMSRICQLAARGASDVVVALGHPARIPYEIIAHRVIAMTHERPELIWGIPDEDEIIICHESSKGIIVLASAQQDPGTHSFRIEGAPNATVEVKDNKIVVTLPGLRETHPLSRWEEIDATMRRLMRGKIRDVMQRPRTSASH